MSWSQVLSCQIFVVEEVSWLLQSCWRCRSHCNCVTQTNLVLGSRITQMRNHSKLYLARLRVVEIFLLLLRHLIHGGCFTLLKLCQSWWPSVDIQPSHLEPAYDSPRRYKWLFAWYQVDLFFLSLSFVSTLQLIWLISCPSKLMELVVMVWFVSKD